MKKFFSMMAVIAAMFAFASCETTPDVPNEPESTKLATPAVEILDVTETGFSVKWNAVEGATSYTISTNIANQKVVNTAETSFTFENLNKGEYTVRVKATGEGKEDSDFSEVKKVNLTGATSIDWFTQTISLVEDNEENKALGRYPFNAADFCWKGTGVVELIYGMFYAEDVAGMSEEDIVSQLKPVDGAIITEVNSEEGANYCFEGLQGSTTYTLCTFVKNEAGITFLVKSNVTTTETEATEETKAWMGTWTAKSVETLVWSETGEITAGEGEMAYDLSITTVPGYADYLLVDGFSVWGKGYGFDALGQVAKGENGENYLYIWNGYEVARDSQSGASLSWTSFSYISNYSPEYDGLLLAVGGSYPSHIFEMTAEGVVCYMYAGELNGGGKFDVFSSDLYWGDEEGMIYIFEYDSDQNGESEYFTEYHAGAVVDMEKTGEAAAQAMASRKADVRFNKSQFSSVVIK